LDNSLRSFSETQISVAISETKHAHIVDQYLHTSAIFKFSIPENKLSAYDRNQTKCMGKDGNSWSDELCETRVEKSKSQ
jgi:hypothetical protein